MISCIIIIIIIIIIILNNRNHSVLSKRYIDDSIVEKNFVSLYKINETMRKQKTKFILVYYLMLWSIVFVILDRVKVVDNGVCSKTSSNEFDHIHLLNILNWSQLENLAISTSSTVDETKAKYNSEPISNTGYNTVQISMELQKRMLK